VGTVILIVLGLFSDVAVRGMIPEYNPKIPWVGIFITLEWHLVWAAASGMETLLSGFLVTTVLVMLAFGVKNYLLVGLLIGLSVWVRPDLATLLGPALLVIFLNAVGRRDRFTGILMLLIGFGVILAFYFLFNLLIAGTPFPNTFYAKQAEYAVLKNIPFLTRFSNIALLPMIGAGIILLPGFIYLVVEKSRKKDWAILSGMIWFLGYIVLYVVRLPVTYQHGRYLMPAMPIFFIWGLAGVFKVGMVISKFRWKWALMTAWQISIGTALLAFWLLGARAYATDVAVIESEMVATARWVSKNLPPDVLVAAHDIGALGFFAPRNLLDLAGLISPEVIPIIRDETHLAEYLDENQAGYLITFPDWYPDLTSGLKLAFSSQGKFAPTLGQENMSVFYWTAP
jgi:MFS family permease